MNKPLQYHQARALKQILIAQALEDPNVLGEALLQYSFVGEGRGCYSNFELRPSFQEWNNGIKFFADALIGEFAGWGDEHFTEYHQDLKRICSFYDPKLDLGIVWFWDGDGHLIFKLGDVILENNDIKKSYNWRFV